MAQIPKNFPARTTTSAERGGGSKVLRSPAVAHMKNLFDNNRFRQYRIVKK